MLGSRNGLRPSDLTNGRVNPSNFISKNSNSMLFNIFILTHLLYCLNLLKIISKFY